MPASMIDPAAFADQPLTLGLLRDALVLEKKQSTTSSPSDPGLRGAQDTGLSVQKLGWLAPFLIPANTEMPPRASTISGPAPDLSACSQREVHPACKIRPLPHDS